MKALIDIPTEINQTLNIIKAQHNLKNKAQAISFVVQIYKEHHMEPELKPEFVKKILKTEHQKEIPFTSIDSLRKRYE